MSKILFLVFFVFSCLVKAKARAPKIELGPAIKGKLSVVLSRADDLRGALVQKQDSVAITKMRELSLALAEALRTPDLDKQSKSHLDRILSEAKIKIERVPVVQGEERKATLQEAFRQLVLIGQTYKVDDSYKFFFCGRDRSVWLQKEGKPQNPINPDTLKTCGVRVD